jgi:farnesyl diphosphate synthase
VSAGILDDRLSAELAARRATVDAELAGIAAGLRGTGLLADAMAYAIDTGGKRLRPVLCLAAADAVQPETSATRTGRVRAATALELIHTYSLVHDDLPCMDDDDLRRGRPTTHVRFDTPTAMLAGLALIPLACRLLHDAATSLGLSAHARAEAVRTLCRGAGAVGMVGGQVLDLAAEAVPQPVHRLRAIHALKTGALFEGSLRLGGMLAGADDVMLGALGRFGAALGMAFQITDDVLDVTMDAAALGKTPGKDQDARKTTFASLLGVDAARDAATAQARTAVAALHDARLESPLLVALARFAVERDR